MMKNVDPEGWIFLSHPHTNNGFFLLLTTKYLILYFEKHEKLLENPEYALCHFNIRMTSQIDVQPACSFLFFILPTGWYEYVR